MTTKTKLKSIRPAKKSVVRKNGRHNSAKRMHGSEHSSQGRGHGHNDERNVNGTAKVDKHKGRRVLHPRRAAHEPPHHREHEGRH